MQLMNYTYLIFSPMLSNFHFLNEYLSTRDLGSYSFKLVLILKVDISLLLLSILIILPGKIYMYKNGVENGRKTF